MSTPMPAPWSFSKWKKFNTCPQQFYQDTVLKRFPRDETTEMRYGTLFHEAAENYIGKGDELPPPFQFARAALDNLNAIDGDKLVEQKMGITADLDPCTFYADNVWWRGISDLNIINLPVAYSVDYKTGSKKSVAYADKGQLELIALAIFTAYPEVMVVKAALFYVVAGAFIKDTYHRDDASKLWVKWIGNFNEMAAAYRNNVWNTKQSGLCYQHCPVLECPHNGRG